MNLDFFPGTFVKITKFGKYTNSMFFSLTDYFRTEDYMQDDIFNDKSRDEKIILLQKLNFEMYAEIVNANIQYSVQI